jgi:hypothetical protein
MDDRTNGWKGRSPLDRCLEANVPSAALRVSGGAAVLGQSSMSAHWPTICTLPTQIVRVFMQKVQKSWSLYEWISTIMIFKYIWVFKLLSMISNPKWKSCAPRGVLSCRDHHHSEPTPISPMKDEWWVVRKQFSVGFQFPS